MKKQFISPVCIFRYVVSVAILLIFGAANASANRLPLHAADDSTIEGRWDLTITVDGKQQPSWLEIRHSGTHRLIGLADIVGPVVDAMVALHTDGRELHRVLFEEAPRPPEQLARLRALERDLTDLVAGMLTAHPDVTAPDPALAARLTIDTIEALVHRVATDAASGVPDDVLATEITRLVVAYLTA